jgi:hypothetical protein
MDLEITDLIESKVGTTDKKEIIIISIKTKKILQRAEVKVEAEVEIEE